jgi:hypothetical protein
MSFALKRFVSTVKILRSKKFSDANFKQFAANFRFCGCFGLLNRICRWLRFYLLLIAASTKGGSTVLKSGWAVEVIRANPNLGCFIKEDFISIRLMLSIL